MTTLIVIGCILLLGFLICQIRVGVIADYTESGFALLAKIGAFKIRLVPGKKDKKDRATKKSKGVKADKKSKTNKDTIAVAKKFLPLVGEASGRFKRKIRIDWLILHVIWASSDPASAAIGFGTGNAVLGILWPVFEQNFRVKSHDLCVDVDFERTTPHLILKLQSTMTVGQGLVLGLSVGIKALKIYLGIRRENTENKAVQA